MAARQAKLDAARDAALEAAMERAEEARRQAWAWFDRVVIRFGWFRALPETVQPILVGLAVALPVIGVIVVLLRPVNPEPGNVARSETQLAPAHRTVQADPDQPPPF